MSRTYEFLKECGSFFVLTMRESFPTGRPFGAVMEWKEKLYVSTGTKKAVYQQLKEDGNIGIVALKAGTRDWIRVKGNALECQDLSVKQRMLEECPILKKRFPAAESQEFAVFEVEVLESYLYSDSLENGVQKIG